MTEESKSEEKEFESEEIKDEVHELQDAEQEETGRTGRARDIITKHQLHM